MKLTGLLRTSLAVRTAAIILLMVASTGVVFLALAAYLTTTDEQWRQLERLNGLLDTVENTVSIAAYLHDTELAAEVAEGLLQNPTVSGVRIWADEQAIAEAGSMSTDGALPVDPLSRFVRSPFDAAEVVGRITLVPNTAEIAEEVSRATWFVTLQLAVMLVLIGAGIMAVVIRLVTRPILRISDRLHRLRAELGEKLDPPDGHGSDEIGRLVGDVNALIDHLVSILRNEQTLRREREIEEKRLRAIFDNVESGIFLVDESGLVVSTNASFWRLFAMPPEERSEDGALALSALIERGSGDQDVDGFIRSCLASDESNSRDFRLGGEALLPARWINVVLSPLEDRNLQGIANDVTKRKLSEVAAEKRAMTDVLTGLNNRLAFEHELHRLAESSPRHGDGSYALMMIDLDHFKEINDSHGHDAGDLVLIHVARLLENAVRRSDFLARLGGDEFVVILQGASDRKVIAGLVDRFLAAVVEPIPIGHNATIAVGASIGIAIHGQDAMVTSELIRRADKAMYRAKRAGGSGYRFHAELDAEERTG